MTTTGLDRERFHGVRGTKAGLTVTGKYQGWGTPNSPG